jgi:uncharacterized protein with GYD domain
MATYFMFGKYTAEGVQGISTARTQKADALIKDLGGKIESIYALLGTYDLVLIVDLPGTSEAMKASIELSKLTGVAFSSAPALAVSDFDQLVGG